jgi:hypothetical protein
MKKVFVCLTAGAMALLLSGCFSLQGFSVLASAIAPGKTTKVQFVMHPIATTPSREFQFVVVGVDDTDLSIGTATWGTNRAFGGPKAMPAIPGFATAMATAGSCSSSGLAFSSITGMIWKGFLTQHKVKDKGAVRQKVLTQVGLKAKASASPDTGHAVAGVTGIWGDDGDSVVDSGDTFLCTGISTSSVYIT